MLKKNEKFGTHNIYTCFDKVSKKHFGTFIHTTDEDMIRTSLPIILMDKALRDIKILRIGRFDEDSGTIFATKPVVVHTDCYTFPHFRCSPLNENLSLEELDTAMKEQKNSMLAKISDFESEENKKEE